MMKWSRIILALLFIGPEIGRSAESMARVVVRLKGSATVGSSLVSLGDVADVEASPDSYRKQLESLDLAALHTKGEFELLSARQIRVRLLLEGVKGNSLVIEGPEATLVVWGDSNQPAKETVVDPLIHEILSQTRELLANHWLAAPEDVEVRLQDASSDVPANLPAGVRPVVELKGRTEPGKMAVRVRWMQGDKNIRSDNFLLESRLNQTVLLAAATIPRGEVCVAQNFVEERRLLDSRIERISAEEAVGRKAKRPLAQGEIVSAKDLVTDRASTANVRARDSVKVIAKKGPLRVVLQTAEVLQAGRPGDIIRVRNLQSGQIINGKVITAKEVEVSLD